MTRRTISLTAMLALAAVLAGCGSDGPVDKGKRPPMLDYIGVMLDGKTTTISRREIGGGPVLFQITNQSKQPIRSVAVKSRYDMPGCIEGGTKAKDIPPGGTGGLQVTLVEGSCEIVADGIASAPLLVGPERPSAQNTLLLP